MKARTPVATTAVGRADLLRLLAAHGEQLMEEMAFAFGFERKPAELGKAHDRSDVDNKRDAGCGADLSGAATPPIPVVERPERLPSARFFRVVRRKAVDKQVRQAEREPPQWLVRATVLDRDARPEPGSFRLPAQLPLAPWTRVWPFLRRVLGESHFFRQPDIPQVVRRMSDGEVLRRLPQLVRHGWCDRICVLLDFNRRSQPFRADFNELRLALEAIHGAAGMDLRVLHGEPGRDLPYRRAGEDLVRRWDMPDPRTPLLILGDLGMLEGSAEIQRAWRHFGRRLRAAGCSAIVLTPVPARQHDPALRRLFEIYEWDRASNFHPSPLRTAPMQASASAGGAETLLGMLAPAILVEPALLRAARYLLPAGEADAGAEAALWAHPDVIAESGGFCLRPAAIDKYQARFRALPGTLRQRLVGLVREHHRALPDSLRLAELDVCGHLVPGSLDEAELREVARWKGDIVKTCLEYPDRAALQEWLARHVATHGEPMLEGNPELAALWALAQRGRVARGEAVTLPGGVRDSDVAFFLEPDPVRRARPCTLRQRGQDLILEAGDVDADGVQEPSGGSHFLDLSLAAARVTVEQYATDAAPQTRLVPLDGFPKRLARLTMETESIRVRVAGEILTIEPTTTPVWAKGMGRNAEGLFVGLQFKGVTQRFRWIAPGSFVMGSPESEPERRDDETLHEVILTRGYWLADSACTQALWQAVMGKNPSRFKGDETRPVEQVSWNDVQEFLAALNARVPGLGARLPTEAEWEYACRAGTRTAFSFGTNITPEQVNYDGNYPYHSGKKGLSRGETVPVKSLPPNAWGLHEMHGNVVEWCADRYGEYPSEAVVDPAGPAGGAVRVLRGGSWIDRGRYARSAVRSGRPPDDAVDLFGFRLALGQAAGAGTAPEPGRQARPAGRPRGTRGGQGGRSAAGAGSGAPGKPKQTSTAPRKKAK